MSTDSAKDSLVPSIAKRYSPYRFDSREVEDEKIICCLEAARWAPSSFNDQPWSWIIAKRSETERFASMLQCLVEANRSWAAGAGVLLVSVVRENFRRNEKPNRVALHDLGQAAAMLSIQAASLGLQAHQMGGVDLDLIRAQYDLPAGHSPQTAIAIGYPEMSPPQSEEEEQWFKREQGGRQRMPLSEQVFAGKWGQASDLVR